jgi:hypothetical protein
VSWCLGFLQVSSGSCCTWFIHWQLDSILIPNPFCCCPQCSSVVEHHWSRLGWVQPSSSSKGIVFPCVSGFFCEKQSHRRSLVQITHLQLNLKRGFCPRELLSEWAAQKIADKSLSRADKQLSELYGNLLLDLFMLIIRWFKYLRPLHIYLWLLLGHEVLLCCSGL